MRGTSATILLLLGLSWANSVPAESGPDRPQASAATSPERANRLHPSLRLRDEEGAPVSDPSQAAATTSCAPCHDVGFITEHSSHPIANRLGGCLACHLNRPTEARPEALPSHDGRVEVDLGTPGLATCGGCHGLAWARDDNLLITEDFLAGDLSGAYGRTLSTGEVFSGQPISSSFLNLKDKASLNRPWDIHLARGLDCSSCHFTANKPARAGLSHQTSAGAPTKKAPAHLIRDPRTLRTHEYLERPDHRLETAECSACHDPAAAHTSLPSRKRHLATLACPACHAPSLSAPALRAVDRTVVTPEGGPRLQFRGVTEVDQAGPSTWFTTGYRPFLLREDSPQGERLAPFNVVAHWEWVANGEPVDAALIKRAFFNDTGGYHEELVTLFDSDQDGKLAANELRLDNPQRLQAIATRLIQLGVEEPGLRSYLSAYPIRHGIGKGAWAALECTSCHSPSSRLNQAIGLASGSLPVGDLPQADQEARSVLAGYRLDRGGDGLRLVPEPDSDDERYVLGHSRRPWSDLAGFGLFALTALGVAGHAGLRVFGARKAAACSEGSPGATTPVKMYGTYERLWHWLMAFSIILLLATGFMIHYPGLTGPNGFATAVSVHNLMAVVMVLNAFLALFYHLTTAEIRQYIPQRAGLFGRILAQVRYYLKGIFLGAAHPTAKTPDAKLNPLQQITYFGLLNLLFPFQILTGLLIGFGGWPTLAAPLHNLGSWLFLSFLVMHVYLTTTGHTLTSNLAAMVTGWEEIPAQSDATSKGATPCARRAR